MNKDNEETKEEFCGACAAGIAALAGVGTATSNRKSKKLIFWIGMSISLISLLVLIYLLCFKDCKECA